MRALATPGAHTDSVCCALPACQNGPTSLASFSGAALVPPADPVGLTPLIDVGDAVTLVQNALRSSTNAVPAAAPHAAQFGWSQSSTLLNRTLVERGIEHWGNDARLCAVRKRLAAGERITVAAVGGSITAGSRYAAGVGSFGAREFLYHRKVLSALGKLYPQPGGHNGHNGGVPGTGPTYMEHCVHDHLPSPVDVVLLEYAVNTDGRAAAFERLLRTLLLHPRAALVVVNAHRWRAIRAHDGRTDKCWNPRWPVAMATNRTQWAAQSFHQPAAMRDLHNRDEDAIGKLAAHYAVPLVSMRGALFDAVRAGELAIPSFMRDCKHPSGEGHTFLAQIALHRILTPPNATGRGAPADMMQKCRLCRAHAWHHRTPHGRAAAAAGRPLLRARGARARMRARGGLARSAHRRRRPPRIALCRWRPFAAPRRRHHRICPSRRRTARASRRAIGPRVTRSGNP